MAEPKRKAAAGEANGVEALSFDDALAELQRVVTELEAGQMPLERTIELYERGVLLHERCGRLLSDAELRIRTLVERAGGRVEAVAPAPGLGDEDDADDDEDDEPDRGGEDDSAVAG
jgi:exodeoxyribonuclease VII small subunit